MPPNVYPIFHASPAQRVALARERFFDEGLRPTGLTSEAVIQSWGRCLRGRRDARERVEFEPVTQSRVHHAFQRNRELIAAWTLELPLLHEALRATTCSAILTDASGVVIAATPSGRPHERLMPTAHRVGINLSEESVGTTAPGIAAKTGRPATVLAGEHYFEDVQTMYCAAAPIRNATGRLTGVLDISSEGLPFGFDASALVALYAGAVEHRLLTAQSTGLLVLRLQVYPTLLDTPMAGLVAVDAAGGLVWANEAAVRFLGAAPHDDPDGASHAEAVFGLRLADLASLYRKGPRLVVLPNGLSIWVHAESAAWDGERSASTEPLADTSAESPPAEVAPVLAATAGAEGPREAANEDVALRELDRDFIARVLHNCGGNVSRAAKQLRVSRGLIYRRMKP